jgi:hypothetical protein
MKLNSSFILIYSKYVNILINNYLNFGNEVFKFFLKSSHSRKLLFYKVIGKYVTIIKILF